MAEIRLCSQVQTISWRALRLASHFGFVKVVQALADFAGAFSALAAGRLGRFQGVLEMFRDVSTSKML